MALVLVPINLLAASIATTLIESGGPDWLDLILVLLIWNAIKFAVMVPVGIGLWVRPVLRRNNSVRGGAQHNL